MYKYKPFYRSVIKNFHSSERYEKLYNYTTRKTIRPHNRLIIERVTKQPANDSSGKFFVFINKLYFNDLNNCRGGYFKASSNIVSAIKNLSLRENSSHYVGKTYELGKDEDALKFLGILLYMFRNSERVFIKESASTR